MGLSCPSRDTEEGDEGWCDISSLVTRLSSRIFGKSAYRGRGAGRYVMMRPFTHHQACTTQNGS